MRLGASRRGSSGIPRSFPFVSAVLGALVACGGGKKETPTRILWTFHAQPDSYASPALSLDEQTVYLGTSPGNEAMPPTGQALHAVSTADGSVRWSFPLGSSGVRSSPAVGPDGSISFVVSTRGATVTDVLHRLSATGALLWTHDVNPTGVTLDVGLTAPAIATDGTTYVAGDRLYAIAPDGSLRWKALAPTGEAMRASPVVGADGTVYFASHNVPLTALDPADGNVLWWTALGVSDHVFASPAMGADGTIYVGDNGGNLYAVSPAGVPRWQFSIGSEGYAGSIRSSPAVGADGTIYFGITQGSPANVLFAVTGAGQLRWIFVPAGLPSDVPASHFDIYSSPAIGADGVIYFGHEFGRVYAVDAAGGTELWMQETSQGITWSSPVLASDGKLFIGDLGGGWYAIDTGGTGLDGSAPWPRYRGDAQGSGRKP